MELRPVIAAGIAHLSDDRLGLTDIGTVAVIGGVLTEAAVRIGASCGIEWEIDGWREGMFFGALIALLFWLFGEASA
ncbi:MAG TPA: hypothetical protein VF729_03645 [Solirubrobacterales bacterium]